MGHHAGGGAASLGGSFAINDITKNVQASISSSEVMSAGVVDLDATSTGAIWALTVGGVGAGAKADQQFGGALTAAGAGSGPPSLRLPPLRGRAAYLHRQQFLPI